MSPTFNKNLDPQFSINPQTRSASRRAWETRPCGSCPTERSEPHLKTTKMKRGSRRRRGSGGRPCRLGGGRCRARRGRVRVRSDTIAGPILQGHPWPIPQQILLRTRLTCCMFGKGFVTIDGPWPRRAACCRPAICGTTQGKPNSWRVTPSDFRFWRAKQFVVQSLGPQNSTLWHSVARPCAAQRLAARPEKFSPAQHS